jgi:hypothetical protein
LKDPAKFQSAKQSAGLRDLADSEKTLRETNRAREWLPVTCIALQFAAKRDQPASQTAVVMIG